MAAGSRFRAFIRNAPFMNPAGSMKTGSGFIGLPPKSNSDIIFVPPAKMIYDGKILYSNSLYLLLKDVNLNNQLILEKKTNTSNVFY